MDIKANSEKILGALNEISRYKLLSGPRERLKQKLIYVDPLTEDPIIKQLLDVKKRYKVKFLVGRRGTGKTTILNRTRIEGFESFLNPESLKYWSQDKDLKFVPVYIDIYSLFQNIQNLEDFKQLENKSEHQYIVRFSKRILIEIIYKIIIFFKEIYEENNKIFSEKELKKIENIYERFKKDLERDVSEVSKSWIEKASDSFKGIFSAIKKFRIKDLFEVSFDYEASKEYWLNIFPNRIFLNTIKKIKNFLPKIDFFYIFFDEFSEINEILQNFLINSLISPLYRNSENESLYFCVSCYPALYCTGDLLKGNDFDVIELDWFKLFQNKKYKIRLENAIEYMNSIIRKRLDFYFNNFNGPFKLSDIFNENEIDIYNHLYFATMNIPRFIGEILRADPCKTLIQNGQKINSNAIKEASKNVYENQLILNYFTNKVYFAENLVFFDQELWNWLISIFRDPQYRRKKAIEAQGFFFIDEELFERENKIFTRLEMMGFLFKIAGFASKHKYVIRNGESYDFRKQALYCIYYGAANFFNLKFPLDKTIRFFRENDTSYHFTQKIIDYQKTKEYFECNICGYQVPISHLRYLEMNNYNCIRTERCKNENGRFIKKYNPSIYKFSMKEAKILEDKLEDEVDYNLKEKLDIYSKFFTKFNKIKLSEVKLLILITLYEHRGDYLTANEISKIKRITSYEYSSHKIAGNIRGVCNIRGKKNLLVDIKYGKRRLTLYKINQKGINYIEYLKSLEQLKGLDLEI